MDGRSERQTPEDGQAGHEHDLVLRGDFVLRDELEAVQFHLWDGFGTHSADLEIPNMVEQG